MRFKTNKPLILCRLWNLSPGYKGRLRLPRVEILGVCFVIVKWNPDGTHDIGGFKSHRRHNKHSLSSLGRMTVGQLNHDCFFLPRFFFFLTTPKPNMYPSTEPPNPHPFFFVTLPHLRRRLSICNSTRVSFYRCYFLV